jgi:ABC-2 type transport system ATP-binding protein
MTARSYLRFFADLYDVPRDVASDRIESTLDRLDLEYRDRRLGDVSKGMKRKVAIARSLVNDPDVLIYDEPASGLDPLTTNSVLAFTEELREDDKTVVFSAHNLYHVESVCDRVVIMNEGRIIARGSVSEIREEHGETSYRVFSDTALDGTEPTADGRHRAVVETMAEVEALQNAAKAAGGSVTDIRTDEPSLESIFLELTGQQMPSPRTAADTAPADEPAADRPGLEDSP